MHASLNESPPSFAAEPALPGPRAMGRKEIYTLTKRQSKTRRT